MVSRAAGPSQTANPTNSSGGSASWRLVAILSACAAASLLVARDAAAFKPEGHVVIEVMAYREIGTGPDRAVLASLIRDGALEAPICFWNRSPDCLERFESDPLAWWPAPHTDASDMMLARQFSHSGQCFHFMAEQDDEKGPHWVDPNNPHDPHVSYGLMWDAYLRCVNQLEWMLWRVVENPVDARKNAHGLYELMHAVMDSYSRAHTERDFAGWKGDVDPAIEFLKIWQPTVGNPFSESSRNTRHEIFEVRDDHYIEPEHWEDGRQCTHYISTPYGMPPGCLSQEARLATNAVEDVMRLVVSMRARRASRAQVHEAWMAFVAKHLAHAATLPRDPKRPAPVYERETVPFVFAGVRGQSLPGSSVFDSTVFGRYMATSGAIDPLTLAVQVEIGTRHDFVGHTEAFLARQDFDAMLSLGNSLSVGLTPFSVDFSAGRGHPDRLDAESRALRLDWFEPLHQSRITISLWGPGEYSWLDQQLRWSAGLAISGGLLEHSPTTVHRAYGPRHKAKDSDQVEWYPPEPWDSEIRSSSGPILLGGYVGATSGEDAGKVREGVQLELMKRNWWGALNPLSFGVLFEDVVEFTADSAPHTSLSLFGTGRWYVFRPLGVVVDAGVNTQDLSGAHLHPWSVQGKGGLVLTIGHLDFIVESPTVPRYDWVSSGDPEREDRARGVRPLGAASPPQQPCGHDGAVPVFESTNPGGPQPPTMPG